MIEFFLGKTGAGKSYLALKRSAEFLREWGDDGIIRTNLSIDTGKLNAYLKKHYPEIEPDVCGRVFTLTDQQVRQFYLYREPGNTLEPVTKSQEQNLQFPDFDGAANRPGSKHVLYIIDEAHIFFDSREWAQVGATLNFFASQHRKFRSDIIFVTQFLDQVEKRLRNHATLFTECVNYGVRRLMIWKMPKLFRTFETPKPPPYPAEHKGTCRMDFELADCFDTTAGVGTKGGRKPEKKRQKGLPFWTMPALGAVLVGVFWYAPDAMVGGAFKMIGGNEEKLTAQLTTGNIAIGGDPKSEASKVDARQLASEPNPLKGAQAFEVPRVEPPSPPKPRVRGYAVRGNGVAVAVMSDGTRITNDEPEWGGIERRGNAVWIENKKHYLVEAYIPQPKPQNVQKGPTTAQERPSSGAVGSDTTYRGEEVVPTPESVEASRRTATLPNLMSGQSSSARGVSGGPRSGPRHAP